MYVFLVFFIARQFRLLQHVHEDRLTVVLDLAVVQRARRF